MTDIVRMGHDFGMDRDSLDAGAIGKEIRAKIEASMVDEGTSVDFEFGMGEACLWFKVGGVEWFLTVRKSNYQKAKDGAA